MSKRKEIQRKEGRRYLIHRVRLMRGWGRKNVENGAKLKGNLEGRIYSARGKRTSVSRCFRHTRRGVRVHG